MPEAKDVLHVKLRVEKFNSNEERFEELDSESLEFDMPLNKHNNRWENECVEKRQIEVLPENISIRQIRLAFLQCPTRINIIKEYNEYDEQKSVNENCVLFLKQMEDRGKLHELWNKLKN